jgi:hypothetical protein
MAKVPGKEIHSRAELPAKKTTAPKIWAATAAKAM